MNKNEFNSLKQLIEQTRQNLKRTLAKWEKQFGPVTKTPNPLHPIPSKRPFFKAGKEFRELMDN